MPQLNPTASKSASLRALQGTLFFCLCLLAGLGTAPAQAQDIGSPLAYEVLRLQPALFEGFFSLGVTAGEFGYLISNQGPEQNEGAELLKVRLATLTIEGQLSLGPEVSSICSAAASKTALILGTCTAPGQVLRIDLARFRESGRLTLNSGEDRLQSVVLDRDHAYFGTGTTPGRIVKVRLDGLQRAATLELPALKNLNCAIVSGQYAYFGGAGGAGRGRIERIDLNRFRNDAALTIGSPPEHALVKGNLGFFVILGRDGYEPVQRLLYVDLPRMKVRRSRLLPGETILSAVLQDNHAYFAYHGCRYYFCAGVVGLDLGDLKAPQPHWPLSDSAAEVLLASPTRLFAARATSLESLDLRTLKSRKSLALEGEIQLRHAVLHGDQAYFLTSTVPSSVVQVGLDDFQRETAKPLRFGENLPDGAFLQDDRFHLFYGNHLVQLDPQSLKRLATLELSTSIAGGSQVVPGDGWADVASFRGLVRVDLQTGKTLKSFRLKPEESWISSFFAAGDFEYLVIGMYFDQRSNTRILKLNRQTLQRVAQIDLEEEPQSYSSVLLDSRHAYIALNIWQRELGDQSVLLKLDLEDFQLQGQAVLPAGQEIVSCARVEGIGYFGTSGGTGPHDLAHAEILEVDLQTLQVLSTTSIPNQGGLLSAVQHGDSVFFGTTTGSVLKVNP